MIRARHAICTSGTKNTYLIFTIIALVFLLMDILVVFSQIKWQFTRECAAWDITPIYEEEKSGMRLLLCFLTKKKNCTRFENTPHRFPTSSIPESLLWQVDRQDSQKLMDSPNEHFHLVTLTFDL